MFLELAVLLISLFNHLDISYVHCGCYVVAMSVATSFVFA
jgi:hypothetical protein